MMTKSEMMERHSQYVSKLVKKLSGISFYHAPFDVMSRDGTRFYEVKCPSDRRGRHKGECRISVSEDEVKFGEIGLPFTYIIIFNGHRFDIPYSDLRERFLRNRVNKSMYGSYLIVKRQITLGKKFLSKYQVENHHL